MLVRIDHIGIVAASFDEGWRLLVDQMGLAIDEGRSPLPGGIYFAPERTNAYFFTAGAGDTRVEMLVPTPGSDTGTARFLARNGPGLHHLAFACEDIDAETERLAAAGLVEIALPKTADGRRTASFFHPSYAGGILTELVAADFDAMALRHD